MGIWNTIEKENPWTFKKLRIEVRAFLIEQNQNVGQIAFKLAAGEI